MQDAAPVVGQDNRDYSGVQAAESIILCHCADSTRVAPCGADTRVLSLHGHTPGSNCRTGSAMGRSSGVLGPQPAAFVRWGGPSLAPRGLPQPLARWRGPFRGTTMAELMPNSPAD